MKVLLLQPASRYYQGSENPRLQIPVGLLSIAAYLDQLGVAQPVVHDARLTARITRDGDSSWFGEPPEQTERSLRQLEPTVVGVSHLFTSQRDTALEAARLARRALPDALVVVGGAAASVEYDVLLDEPAVDCVVVGEGEHTFAELVQAIDAHQPLTEVAGLALRSDDGTRLTAPREPIADLDTLPLPAYGLVDMERYFELQARGLGPVARELGQRSIPIVTSRGCPYTCTFCSVHLSMGRRWRAHSVDYTMEHLAQVVGAYGVDLVHFSDDNLGQRPSRLEELVDRIAAAPFAVRWDTPNGLRADRLGRGLLQKMKRSGCVGIHVAIESGVQRVLDEVVRKRLSLVDIERVARDCHDIGLDLQAFYVIGMPGETLADIRATCRYAARQYWRYGVYPHVSIATPLPGTELLATCEKEGYLTEPITPRSISRAKQFFGQGLIRTSEFSFTELSAETAWLRKAMMAAFVKHSLRHPVKGLRDLSAILKNPGYLFRKFVLGR